MADMKNVSLPLEETLVEGAGRGAGATPAKKGRGGRVAAAAKRGTRAAKKVGKAAKKTSKVVRRTTKKATTAKKKATVKKRR